jgi:hypothetical protein
MPEFTFDQAHGLQRWALQPPTRVVSVVASGDGPGSLELLWALEQAFQALGFPVAVVEGLHGLRPQDAEQGHQAVLGRWLAAVPRGSVVLLHVPLNALAVLLADSCARPLVVMAPSLTSVVQAYNAVKVLVQAAGLQPVVVMAGDANASGQESVTRSLLDTCEKQLGVVPAVWPLGYYREHSGNGRSWQDANLLKVLDSALLLEESGTRNDVELRFEPHQRQADQTVGVSDVHRQRHA